MNLASSLLSRLNSSDGRPAAPAVLLFFKREIAIRISCFQINGSLLKIKIIIIPFLPKEVGLKICMIIKKIDLDRFFLF